MHLLTRIRTYLPWLILLVSLGIITYMLITHYQPAPDQDESDISVVTSFYPLYFFASEIASDSAEVSMLTPSGVEPHEYEPSARDMARIEASDLVLINGGLEEWASHIIDQLPQNQPVVVRTMPDLENDPHTWLSPTLAQQEVSLIAEGLSKVDPENAEAYRSRALQVQQQLETLDQEYQSQLASCQKNEFITAHNSFAYLAREYGLTQIAIAGVSPEEEPTPKRLVEITDQIKKNDIKYVFFETLVSPELSQVLAREAGVQTLVLDPLEGLTPEDMAEGKNYFSVMRDNLHNLAIALEC